MSKKKKGRNKVSQSFRVSGGPGIFYSSKLCPICKKLIWGSSPKSHRQAEKDLGLKMQTHKQDCQRQPRNGEEKK